MPSNALRDFPDTVLPYVVHGVLVTKEGDDEYVAECPFCRKEKLYISVETGLSQCKVCGTGSNKGGMNHTSFMAKLWDLSDRQTKDYNDLAAHRKLLFPETLSEWGVCKSIITGMWCVPGFGVKGGVTQLYRYVQKDGSGTLKVTKGTEHGIHGVNLYNKDCETVYLCEGPWDGAALYEVLGASKFSSDDDGELVFSGRASSFLSTSSVLAVPGCTTFKDQWVNLLADKDVVLLYDSDHPNPETKQPSAGFMGMKRVAGILTHTAKPPKTIRYIDWGKEGYDPEKKHGYDIRDLLCDAGSTMDQRREGLKKLFSMIKPIPEDWGHGRTPAAKKSGGTEVELIPCTEYRKLRHAWQRALKLTDKLDYGLSLALATVASTDLAGDQLWIRLISVASSGKTTICEGISTCKTYVYPTSVLTGLHSGWKTDADGEEDYGMIPKIKGKTLIIKEGDTLLKSSYREKVMSELRDVYDRVTRSNYMHGVSRVYEDIDLTVIFCGTPEFLEMDDAELGARFLTVIIMMEVDEDLEQEINSRIVNRTLTAMRGDLTNEDNHEVLLSKAYRMTGGYVEHLRINAKSLMKKLEVSGDMLEKISHLGRFVAYMRARPSKTQSETVQREFSGRLVSQLTRLACCLAIVLNKDKVDEDVMKRVHQCAMDTSGGVTLRLVHRLAALGRNTGGEPDDLTVASQVSSEKTRKLLTFLRNIKVVEQFDWTAPAQVKANVKGMKIGTVRRKRWRLTTGFEKLYREVNSGNDS